MRTMIVSFLILLAVCDFSYGFHSPKIIRTVRHWKKANTYMAVTIEPTISTAVAKDVPSISFPFTKPPESAAALEFEPVSC